MIRGLRIVGAVALGVAVGFATRSHLHQPSAPDPSPSDSSQSRKVSDRGISRAQSRVLSRIDAQQVTEAIALLSTMTTAEECRQFANQLLNDPENSDSETLWNILMARWSEIDPKGMIDFSEKQPGHLLRNLAWEAWAATDPDLLATKVVSMGPPNSIAVLKGIASRDPDLALELCFKTPGANVWALMSKTEGFTPEAIRKHLQKAAYNGMRNPMIDHLARNLARENPKKALEFLNEKGRSWSDPAAQLFAQVAREDPAKAVILLKDQPTSRSKAISTVQIAKNWASTDPEASLKWARSQTSAQVRDTSLVAIASVIGGEDPDQALALLDEVGWKDVGLFYSVGKIRHDGFYHDQIEEHDVAMTHRVGRSLLENLAMQDPEAARKYIETKVPEDRRASLLTIFKSTESE